VVAPDVVGVVLGTWTAEPAIELAAAVIRRLFAPARRRTLIAVRSIDRQAERNRLPEGRAMAGTPRSMRAPHDADHDSNRAITEVPGKLRYH
jgi:hypothetical protein